MVGDYRDEPPQRQNLTPEKWLWATATHTLLTKPTK